MKQNGFSLIELLVVISLSVVLAGAGLLAYSQVKQNQEMEAMVMRVSQVVNSGRIKSITGEEDTSWKFGWTAEKVWLENGKNEKVEEYWLMDLYSLVGPGSELEFNRNDGRIEACAEGCNFEIRQNNGNNIYYFRILFSGVVEN